MEGFEYACSEGTWITQFMISPLCETPYDGIPAPYPPLCKVNGEWSQIISPSRMQFVAEGEFQKRAVQWLDCEKLYMPFEGEKVEYSGFWMRATQLDFAAAACIVAPKTESYPFKLSSCGGVKLYVNGSLQGSLFGYQRNQEQSCILNLNLAEGENRIYIECNELAERDTQFYFKLRYLGRIPLKGQLPAEIDKVRITEVRALLDGAYLDRFNYHTPDIRVRFRHPCSVPTDLNVRLQFVDAHIPLPAQSMHIRLLPEQTDIQAGGLIDRKAGMVSVTLSVDVCGLTVSRTLQFEYYDESIIEEARDADPARRKRKTLEFLARYGVPNFQKALAMYETGTDTEQAGRIMEEEIARADSRFDCSDFRLPAFFYALRSDKVPGRIKERLCKTVLDYRYWFDEPGNDVMWFFSENHALCFHACELLAGEMFPERQFSCSGMTGEEHVKKAKGLLQKWFDNFLEHGFTEWNSAVYIPIDVIGMTALFELASDPEIKRYAKAALDKTFEILAVNSFRGIVAASYGRIYFKNLIGRRTGEASALNFIVSGEGWLNQHCFSTVLLALSGYRPDERILSLYQSPKEGVVNTSVQGETGVKLYSYKTPDYVMASAQNYRPGKPGLQEHVFQLMVKDCDTQIWINHPGEAVYFGEGRPSYFAGNGTLPNVLQVRNRAVLTYDLLDQEVGYTHAYCPLSQFDEWVQCGNWLFMRKQDICVGLCAQNGITITREGPLKFFEVISKGKHNVWRVAVEKMDNTGEFGRTAEAVMAEPWNIRESEENWAGLEKFQLL